MWKIGNLQKPRWQMLSSSSSCKGHNRIVFGLSAGAEHFTTLVSVSMDRQVRTTWLFSDHVNDISEMSICAAFFIESHLTVHRTKC